MSSKELSLRERTDKVVATLQLPAVLEQIEQSLPENVTLERFVRIAITAIRSNPDLAKADEQSLFASIVKCAQDGLFPDGRDAALVIYSGNVQYLPMIGGLRKIAGSYGWDVRTQVVRAVDEFEFEEGLEPTLTHRRPKPGVDRGDLVNAYAIAQHTDGRKLFVVLDEDEIAKCRAVSKAKDKAGAPWQTWTERMWEKTAGKRLIKQLPLSDRELVDRVLARDDTDPSEAAEMLYGPGGSEFTATPAPPADAPAAGTPAESSTLDDDDRDGGGQQAGPAAEPTAAAPAPDPDDEDEPLPPAAAHEAELAEAAQTVADTVVPSGGWQGMTLAQVADAGDTGVEWLGYALRHTSKYDDSFVAALETYVQGALPGLWASHVEWVGQKAAA